jgi:chromosome segregation ATPase
MREARNIYLDSESTAELLERRWFATSKAISALRADCEVLREVIEDAESAWTGVRRRLAELETVRDALGDDLAEIDGRQDVVDSGILRRDAMSAA